MAVAHAEGLALHRQHWKSEEQLVGLIGPRGQGQVLLRRVEIYMCRHHLCVCVVTLGSCPWLLVWGMLGGDSDSVLTSLCPSTVQALT